MDNIKITASFKLKGGIMYSERDKNGKPLHYDVNTIDFYNHRKNKTETITFKTSRCKPSIQAISMSMEAYKYMINTPTDSISTNHWKRMSENQRIAKHLKEIQHDLGAISFEFTVLKD